MTADLVEQLQGAGIEIARYRRPPLGKDVFAIAISSKQKGGQIRIHPGVAEITARTDKRYRQAVLDVVEPARRLTEHVAFDAYNTDSVQLRARARRSFSVAVPAGRTSFEVHLGEYKYFPGGHYRYNATVTANVKSSRQHFLIGFDEKYHFVAALPRRAKSVIEAHWILRPTTVRRGGQTVRRQGEWFFIPVSEEMGRRLDQRVPQQGRAVGLGGFQSTHRAATAIRLGGRRRYVKGFVYDTRPSHHAPLFLPKWHRVVRNTEIVVRSARARTWD